MWHCTQVKEKTLYNFPGSWLAFRSISPVLHFIILFIPLLPGSDCSKMQLKGWPCSYYFKWRISKAFISLFFPGLGIKTQNVQQRHLRNHWFVFLYLSRMEWLFLINSNILVSTVPSQIPKSMAVSEMEGTGDELSFYSGFTAVGGSTSSWWKLTLVFVWKELMQ